MFGYTPYAVPQQGLRAAAIGSLGSIYLEVRESLTILGDPIFYGGTLRSCITAYPEAGESLTILGGPMVEPLLGRPRGGTHRSCTLSYALEDRDSLTISGTRPHKLMWLVASRSCISV